MSDVETGQMSAVEAEQAPAAETGQMPAVEISPWSECASLAIDKVDD